MLGGEETVLIIDATCLTKFENRSVGVGPQYCGQVGKMTNCQVPVSAVRAWVDVVGQGVEHQAADARMVFHQQNFHAPPSTARRF